MVSGSSHFLWKHSVFLKAVCLFIVCDIEDCIVAEEKNICWSFKVSVYLVTACFSICLFSVDTGLCYKWGLSQLKPKNELNFITVNSINVSLAVLIVKNVVFVFVLFCFVFFLCFMFCFTCLTVFVICGLLFLATFYFLLCVSHRLQRFDLSVICLVSVWPLFVCYIYKFSL